jgi:hypothetical protein
MKGERPRSLEEEEWLMTEPEGLTDRGRTEFHLDLWELGKLEDMMVNLAVGRLPEAAGVWDGKDSRSVAGPKTKDEELWPRTSDRIVLKVNPWDALENNEKRVADNDK